MPKTKNMPLLSMLKGLLAGCIFTAIVFFTYALLITYTDIRENHVSTTALVTTAISCIISGFITARSAESKGLLRGMFSGLMYAVIMLAAAFALIPSFMPAPKFIVTAALAAASGGLGGTLGINLKHAK